MQPLFLNLASKGPFLTYWLLLTVILECKKTTSLKLALIFSFPHVSVDGQVNLFYILDTVNKAAMDMLCQFSLVRGQILLVHAH